MVCGSLFLDLSLRLSPTLNLSLSLAHFAPIFFSRMSSGGTKRPGCSPTCGWPAWGQIATATRPRYTPAPGRGVGKSPWACSGWGGKGSRFGVGLGLVQAMPMGQGALSGWEGEGIRSGQVVGQVVTTMVFDPAQGE